MAKVSIGVPVYNGENYIREAIDSILSQTFQDFELIISDNASTDGTEKICKEYAERNKHVHYYHNKKNLGATHNFNRLFELARGKYFKWASHDDVCAPPLLQRCVEILDREPAVVLCYSKTTFIDEHSQKIAEYEDRLNLCSPAPHKRLYKFLRKPAGCNPVFGLMRSKVLSTTQLIRPYESSDYNLLAELCLRGQFYEIPERLFFRRNHPQMSRRAVKKSRDFARWFDSKYQGTNAFPVLKVFFELISCIKHAPISGYEKLLCYSEIIKSTLALSTRTITWVRARKDQKRMY